MTRLLDYPSSLSARLDASPAARDGALLLVRVALAAVFVYHGSQKLFGWFGGWGLDGAAKGFEQMGIPLPYLSAVLASSAEFFGAILLVLGVAFRPAAAVMAFTMVVATLVHLPKGYGLANGGAEYPLTLLAVLVALALLGPGRWTVARLATAGRAERDLVPAVGR